MVTTVQHTGRQPSQSLIVESSASTAQSSQPSLTDASKHSSSVGEFFMSIVSPAVAALFWSLFSYLFLFLVGGWVLSPLNGLSPYLPALLLSFGAGLVYGYLGFMMSAVSPKRSWAIKSNTWIVLLICVVAALFSSIYLPFNLDRPWINLVLVFGCFVSLCVIHGHLLTDPSLKPSLNKPLCVVDLIVAGAVSLVAIWFATLYL